MPIHVRAEPGDYAEYLLPGDPLRAKYIAETFFDDPVQRNEERGMLGYENLRRQAGIRAVDGNGLPDGGGRHGGARPARRQEVPAGRHLRRAPAGHAAR